MYPMINKNGLLFGYQWAEMRIIISGGDGDENDSNDSLVMKFLSLEIALLVVIYFARRILLQNRNNLRFVVDLFLYISSQFG